MVLAKDLKEGHIIKTEEGTYKITSVKVSNIGKHGRSKCRLDATNTETNQPKILVVLADQEMTLQ